MEGEDQEEVEEEAEVHVEHATCSSSSDDHQQLKSSEQFTRNQPKKMIISFSWTKCGWGTSSLL